MAYLHGLYPGLLSPWVEDTDGGVAQAEHDERNVALNAIYGSIRTTHTTGADVIRDHMAALEQGDDGIPVDPNAAGLNQMGKEGPTSI